MVLTRATIRDDIQPLIFPVSGDVIAQAVVVGGGRRGVGPTDVGGSGALQL